MTAFDDGTLYLMSKAAMARRTRIWLIALVLVLSGTAAIFLIVRPKTTPASKFTPIEWTTLAGFKYDTYEVLNDVDGGRPFTRSDDVIPANVKALDGRPVTVTGFIMPLRLKKGLVTEFLLFKDQASCCFGPAAKMNHYMRVKMNTPGFPPSATLIPYRVEGTLRVGEIMIQGYLTGIYELSAEKVVVTK
jgi:hypothetical protein